MFFLFLRFMYYLLIYLIYFWLRWVLVVACRIFIVVLRLLSSCGVWVFAL